jgi:acetyltransferase
VRIVGPNCVGVIATAVNLNATFADQMALPGKMAFISQSGALCTGILDLSLRERIGFSHFISIGSMLDVDFGDLIDFLGNDPDVHSIVLYVEGLTHFRKFMSAARAVSRIKPIVVLKAGRSLAGARAAASHTGSLAGADDVYDAAFKRAGIVRVNTIEELFDCAELMASEALPRGPELAIVTNAGGPGVMAADALCAYGLEPVALQADTLARLSAFLPAYWSHGNPIDILGDATPDRFAQTLRVCLAAPEIRGLVIILVPQAISDPAAVATALVNVLHGRTCPVFAVTFGGHGVEPAQRIFSGAGIPSYETPERAIAAFMHLWSYKLNLEALQEIPPKLPHALSFDRETARAVIQGALDGGVGLLGELETKQVLSAYGIPTNRTEMARSAEEAVRLAEAIGYPVVLKIYSPDISHKTDVGGVRLNIANAGEVAAGFREILAACHSQRPDALLVGVTVQAMMTHADCELILGSKRDPDFGPVLLFGMGGILTEILKDRAIALPPLNRLLARRVMEETKVYRLLQGYRGRPTANLVLLEEILMRLSQLVTDFAEIAELDINPLMVTGDSALAVDARMVLKPSGQPAPFHLAISAYPNQYECHVVTAGGDQLFIRPIRPEDAPLLTRLFHTLSPRSVIYRFFRMLKEIPRSMLARFTQIDYDREMALVALRKTDEGEEILGVGRVMGSPGGRTAEFSILVSDPWQGRGIGAELLKRSLLVARERGVEEVWGLVLAENTQMLALGRALGFTVKKVADASEFELRLDVRNLEGLGLPGQPD